ncbi:MAG TPA: type I secretion system permease/ATPase [Burkholderiales bacterium]|jgi:PrtD family type I secretion system ABC transporter
MGWLFARHLRPFVLLAGAASLALNLALLAPALYMVQVFDRVFASRSVETLAMLSLAALLTLALGYCMDTVRSGALAWAGAALERRLSPAALAAALRQAASIPGRVDTDALRDIGKLRAFLGGSGIQALFDAPWLPIYVAVIAFMHPLLGATATVGAALIAGIAVLTERLTRTAAAHAVQKSRDASRHVEALARNAEVVVGMGMTQAALAAWQGRHDELLAARARLGTASARLAAAARIARQGLQLAMLAIGAWLVIGADASPGIMIAATILLGRALQPLEQLVGGWKALLDARGAWRRLNERASIGRPESALKLPAPAGRLELERVVFGPAPMRPALIKGVGFALAPGESLGLVGPSASGKTTLLRLILGLWKPQAGCVRLDGADISLWERGALGKHVGYLPQDVSLLGGTVAQNIARLGPVDSASVVAAARLAHAHDMILRLPQGYETEIGEAGAVLSGGQRQRIALARALFGDPRLVVLDEPNANLDAEGEAALQAALRELKARGVTVIMAGHRPALMSQLDKLALLNGGVLEAFGPAAAVFSRLRAAA